MVADIVNYNTGESIKNVRGSEINSEQGGKGFTPSPERDIPVSMTPVKQQGQELQELSESGIDAWRKLTTEIGKTSMGSPSEASSMQSSAGSDHARSVAGKSPRKNSFMQGDSCAQPPLKKECLSEQAGGTRQSSSAENNMVSPMSSAPILGTQHPQRPPHLKQYPITTEALFGSVGGAGGSLSASPMVHQGNGVLPVSALGGLKGTGSGGGSPLQAVAQSHQILMQLIEHHQTMQLMHLQQLQQRAALGVPYLDPTVNLAEQLSRFSSPGGSSLGGISPNKTSTPKAGGKFLPSTSRLNTTGYNTDSSFNTSAENSLHELVSKIALQGPNLSDALSTTGNALNAEGNSQLDLLRDQRWTNPNYIAPSSDTVNTTVDAMADQHRKSAANSEATCTWVGQLPPRNIKNPVYSCKVFLGGVPWDITELQLKEQFSQFGPVTVDWPGKDKNHGKNPPSGKGYVYLIFENDKAIRQLLTDCKHDFAKGEFYMELNSKRARNKNVQVIPWAVNDSNFSRVPQGSRTETQRTVFVGALHGMLNAEALANIMNDLFGGVTFAGIDTDKYKYPIGSGRVAFNNDRSYMKAVSAGFIEIKANKFSKKVQVDPYLDDHLCSQCAQVPGQYFCREVSCFTYYCLPCWNWHHSIEAYKPHVPLTRNSKVKNNIVPPVTPVNHMPQTQFGLPSHQFQSQSSGDSDSGIMNGLVSSFQPFANSATGGLGSDTLGAIMNMATSGGGSGSCAGAAGIMQQGTGGNLGMQSAIEAFN